MQSAQSPTTPAQARSYRHPEDSPLKIPARKLTSFECLAIDLFGTCIDWETGILDNLVPLLERALSDPANPLTAPPTRTTLLTEFARLERLVVAEHPTGAFKPVLKDVHRLLTEHFRLPPDEMEDEKFAVAISYWPEFSDTLDALLFLSEQFKLVLFTDVDRESAQRCIWWLSHEFAWDCVVTCDEVPSFDDPRYYAAGCKRGHLPEQRSFDLVVRVAAQEAGLMRESDMLVVAQNRFQVEAPANKFPVKYAWIAREGAVLGNVEGPGEGYDYRFASLADLVKQVKKELREAREAKRNPPPPQPRLYINQPRRPEGEELA